MADTILVIGANGQLGAELTDELRKIYGDSHVIAADIRQPAETKGIFEILDVTDAKRLAEIVGKYSVTQIYHLAAILSATGEKNPQLAWHINMTGLMNVLEIARIQNLKRIYWPSSIAVFGTTTPRDLTPQHTVVEPQTVYGISKYAGELWCQYYFEKYGVDVRSLRYPGLIGYKALPGGGTTDYAVDIYHKAIDRLPYECFLSENTYLPMMYMPDALRGTLELMHADSAKVKLRTSYNLSGMSFSPAEITRAIQVHYPDFQVRYRPDFRQQIADSWPKSIDDTAARRHWGWQPKYDLSTMTADMLLHLADTKKEMVM